MSNTIHIVGCGGAGVWLSLILSRSMHLYPNTQIILQDGDTIEKRNLDRQLFSEEDIGKNKAQALADQPHMKMLEGLADIKVIPEYLDDENKAQVIENPTDNLLLISATDNFPARCRALLICDRRAEGSTLLISPGNDYETAEAYVYRAEWKGSATLDPRIRFPEHMTDTSDDPLVPACNTQEAQEKTPQLALANATGAIFAANLMYFWVTKADTQLEAWVAGGGEPHELAGTYPTRYESMPSKILTERGLLQT